MNRAEAIRLCRYVHAVCPGQRLDEYTPQAWADVLDGLPFDFDDGRQAVVDIKRRQPFVDCSEIITECRRARHAAAELQQREQIHDHAVRRQLHDPRPAAETIRAIVARFGRRELLPPVPAQTAAPDKPRHQQLAELEAMGTTP